MDKPFAAVEALLAVVACLFSAGLAKAAALALLGGSADAVGLAQALAPLAVLAAVYGGRFAGASSLGALARALRSLAPRAALSPLSLPARCLLIFHALQLLAIAAAASVRPPAGAALPAAVLDAMARCASRQALVWAPIFEELTFRVVAFYVALQRSGGDLPFAALATACLFGAVHLPNVASAAATGGAAHAWLQVACACLFGATWTLVFAASGSAFEAVALHVANNAVAVAFISLVVTGGGAADCDAAGAALPSALLASLALQCAVYVWAMRNAWARITQLAAVDGGRPLRGLHTVVYGAA